MSYKDFAFFTDINWGVLPRSFFYFEMLLWIVLVGFPLFIFLLHWYKKVTFSVWLKGLVLIFTLFFSLLSFIWTSSVWVLLMGVFIGIFVYRIEYFTAQFKWLITGIFAFCWLCTVWGSYTESQLLVLREFDLEIENFPELRMVLVADFHIGPYKQSHWVKRVVEGINSIEDVDGVFIPGDFTYGDAAHYAPMLYPLADLKYPTYLTLGNHDHHRDPDKNAHQAFHVNKYLEQFGHPALNNQSQYLEDKDLFVVGVDDNDLGFHDLGKALQAVEEGKPYILLAHSPDIIDELPQDDTSKLILSGHTHCGQLRVPGYGALPLTIPTRNDKKYEKHHYQEENTHLFITCGVGEVGPRGRFFNPPEIVILNIN